MCCSGNSHLCVEATGCLQEQRQVGLDLAAVGVGPVLGLALQRGDLVLERMIPPAHTHTHTEGAWSELQVTYGDP